jgi:phage terminase small subunit
MAAPKPLSPKQLKFVELYLKGSSAKQAYIDAGYAARGHSAEVNAERLLRNAEVDQAVKAAREQGKGKAGITAEWWFGRLKLEATRKANSGAARVAALKVMGQAAGYITDKVQVSGPDGGPIQVKADHEHRLSLTAADLDAVERLVASAAGGGVPADG